MASRNCHLICNFLKDNQLEIPFLEEHLPEDVLLHLFLFLVKRQIFKYNIRIRNQKHLKL